VAVVEVVEVVEAVVEAVVEVVVEVVVWAECKSVGWGEFHQPQQEYCHTFDDLIGGVMLWISGDWVQQLGATKAVRNQNFGHTPCVAK
jgi:hypothetical protein